VSLPSVDPLAERLRAALPECVAFQAVRWKNILMQIAIYQLSRRRPAVVKRLLRRLLSEYLPSHDIDRHFTPRYDPWDQRLCVVPDGDLFREIRRGRVSIATDHVEAFTETGVRLRSGAELEADVIITATGLNLLVFGGIELSVDGEPVDAPSSMTYKGMMLEGVPNLAFALGYTNASWTLKADLTGEYVVRLLQHMDRRGLRRCVAVNDDPTIEQRPLLDFQAGYVLRALPYLPKSGSRRPWRLRMNYAADVLALRLGRVDDGVMRFSAPAGTAAEHAELTAA
jgi:monooxygenase